MRRKDTDTRKRPTESERKGEVDCSWSLVLYLLNPLGILQLLNITKIPFGNVCLQGLCYPRDIAVKRKAKGDRAQSRQASWGQVHL